MRPDDGGPQRPRGGVSNVNVHAKPKNHRPLRVTTGI